MMYYLTLAKTYVSNWSIEDAVRELCQNALDHNGENILDHTLTGNSLAIRSVGIQLHPSSLLLGSSDKGSDTPERGMHGEGFKLALLILLREGLDVVIENGSVIWRPRFAYNEAYGCEMLAIEEYENPNEATGLTFMIKGFTETEAENFTTRTLQMQEGYEKIETKYGDILTDERHKGFLFVGGLYVCRDESFVYGYDFKASVLPLNRDRQTLPDWDLKVTTKNMLEAGLPTETFVDNLEKNTVDVSYARYYSPAEEVRVCAHERFVEEYGDVPIAECSKDQANMVADGYSNAVILSNDTLRTTIKRASTYSPEKVGERVTPLTLVDAVIEEHYEYITINSSDDTEERIDLMLEGIRHALEEYS